MGLEGLCQEDRGIPRPLVSSTSRQGAFGPGGKR